MCVLSEFTAVIKRLALDSELSCCTLSTFTVLRLIIQIIGATLIKKQRRALTTKLDCDIERVELESLSIVNEAAVWHSSKF